MNTKALNSLADLICRAQEQGKRTPMGIAMAIDSAGRHMSPEVAAELHDLRTRLAGMANPPRELFLALYDGTEPELFTTAEAARACCNDLAPVDAHGNCWDWTVNEFGVHVQFWTHPDDDRPLSETSGSVTPIVVQGDDDLSELAQLRARVAALLEERHRTNEWADDAAKALRADRDRIAELEAELRIGAPWKCDVCGKENTRDVCVICETDRPDPAEEPTEQWSRLYATPAALREDPHDGPLHHSYRVGRDLPETGGAQ